MWDYDKLFADGNIIGIKNCYRDKVFNNAVDITTGVTWLEGYKNEELSCKDQYVDVDDKIKHGYTTDFKIQYIIRLDEHGNVAEKLFDRERDMKKLMPKLETGMFVYVPISGIGFVDAENNRIIYQNGGFDYIQDNDFGLGVVPKITKVYNKNVLSFDCINKYEPIWSKSIVTNPNLIK